MTFKVTKDVTDDGVYECIGAIDINENQLYIFDTRFRKSKQ